MARSAGAVSRREAMKTALKGSAYAAPMLLSAVVPPAVAAASPAPLTADLALTQVASMASPVQGSTVTFTLTLVNNGPGQATGVSVTDALTAGLRLVRPTPSGSTTYNGTSGVWNVGTLANGASATLQLVATVTGTVGAAITNTASISHRGQSDPNPSNDSADVTVTPKALHFAPVPSPFYVGIHPVGIAVGDFNGDGNQDLAVANNVGNSVSVLLGNGRGGFTPAPGSPIAVGSGPMGIAVGDFNRDGKMDLAVTNNASGTVSVLLGDGSGGFTPAPGSPVGVGGGPSGIAVGDFNGDGKPDLAVVNVSSNTVSVLLGNGDGSFAHIPGLSVSVGIGPMGLVIGDFNGDGHQDFAVTNSRSNTVSVLLGNGSGAFTNALGGPYRVGAVPVGIATADFNGDGNLDLAVINQDDGTMNVLIGDGRGFFAPAPDTPVATGVFPKGILVADFSGDGIPDLVVQTGAGTLTILSGNGNGGFVKTPDSPSSGSANGFAVGDFNGDRKLDFAFTQGLASTLFPDAFVSILLQQ